MRSRVKSKSSLYSDNSNSELPQLIPNAVTGKAILKTEA